MKTRQTKPNWDLLASHYCHAGFVLNDPISFPHAYRLGPDWRDTECTAFLAALFSYGRRDKILETVSAILSPLGPSPLSELVKASSSDLKKQYKGFYYRFNTDVDLVFLLIRLSAIYQEYGSLKHLWAGLYEQSGDLRDSIHQFRNIFLHQGTPQAPKTYGMKFLFADPAQNSAAKRFNMFLRWMVREDVVDFGLWSDVTPASALVFPLDTHVATMARHYGITQRKSNDWKTAMEITDYFRKLCPEDPVRYDFALFGLGVEGNENKLVSKV